MAKSSKSSILSRIDRRLKALAPPGRPQLSDRAASLKSGLSPDGIRTIRRQIESGRQKGLSSETLQKLAQGLETTEMWLLKEEGAEYQYEHIESDNVLPETRDSRKVRVQGYVGASGEAFYYRLADESFEEVDAPPGANDDTVAVEVRGTSLGEAFNSWLVFYRDIRSPVTEDLIGRLCVVGLADDRILVKIIKRGPRGRFDLVSNSATEPPIEGAEIEWAAKVTDMRPR